MSDPDPDPKLEPTKTSAKQPQPKISSEIEFKAHVLRKRFHEAASEVQNINDEGRLALIDQIHVSSFRGMYKALESYHNRLVDSYQELCALAEVHKFTFPSPSDKTLKANSQRYYYEALTTYERLQERTSAPSQAQNSTVNATTVLNSDATHSLPKLDLPKFNGDLLTWTRYRDTFESLVQDDPNMSQMRKYHYLKLSLEGQAAALISHLPMDAANYPLAWAAIKENYDNTRLLASAYLDQILSFKPLEGKVTPQGLQSFLMKINDSVTAFNLLRINDPASFILFHVAVRCLDSHTREKFELAHKGTEFPKFEDLIKFVKDQARALQLASSFSKAEVPSPRKEEKGKKHEVKRASKQTHASLLSNDPKPKPECFVCQNGSHSLIYCKVFMDLPLQQRLERVKKFSGCLNCFSYQHKVDSCNSKWVCRWCKQKHNSAICSSALKSDGSEKLPSPSQQVGSTVSLAATNSTQILLGTALVQIRDGRGQYQTARLVIDCGSHYSFITQRLLRKLGLEASSCNKRISGIGQTIFDGSKGQVACTLRPIDSVTCLSTNALVVKDITTLLPTVSLPYHLWSQYLSYPLADPKFFESSSVDFLLGADLFADIWAGSAITIEENLPKIFPTIFGHVVVGKYTSPSPSDGTSLLALTQHDDLMTDLRKFWETEEPVKAHTTNPDDLACENHFAATHYRNSDGSFVVKLPFKRDPPDLSDISTSANRRFLNLEDKLRRQPVVKEKYHEFMTDYVNLGHMSFCKEPEKVKYVIPHHSVVKEDRNKIKLRVVFDASARSSLGSLNDYLYVGPKLQNDIKDILLNFRSKPIVFVADIVHFFRSIWIDQSDQVYQCIYWRFLPTDAVSLYQLHTLTYGMSSSPYLACAVIRELCNSSGSEYPLASAALERDTYIDDTTTGAETVQEALELQDQLITLLSKGGFKLSKWASNSSQVLDRVRDYSENDPINLTSKEDVTLKILGLQWDSSTDCFLYKITRPCQTVSKRSILSAVSRIYDPLGLLSPYVISLKSFIQELWKIGLDWDTPLPIALAYQWESAVEDIETIGKIRIPRFTCLEKPYSYQIVGFCDASETAYAGVIYLKIMKGYEVKVQLLTAKTKLAPLRKLTIPRLELSGALLLTQLYSSISGFLSQLHDSKIDSCFFSDSSIVLAWLNTPSYRLKTYVSNRVNMITDQVPSSSWRHVESSQNPADVASRGLTPEELLNHEAWWNGPAWLKLPESDWPKSAVNFIKGSELPETKSDAAALITSTSAPVERFLQFIGRFSSYLRLLRVVAQLLRLASKAKHEPFREGPLLYSEINEALIRLVKFIQLHHFFAGDINNTSSTMTRFAKLNPFFDSLGVLRAGGRLQKASLPFSHRHPILLPPDSHFTDIMVDHFHRFSLHSGPSLLQAIIQTRFWIPSLRRVVQKRIFLCKLCYESSAKAKKSAVPIMADLPASRLQGIRAFLRVGCDFMGPFNLKSSLLRKAAVTKVYVCLYVCMSTKAVHLEVVSSLSSDAFLASFDRFLSRRGLPSDVYSDCGTNFVAAASHLKDLWNWYKTEETQHHIMGHATSKGVQWHFNPPRGPHFGGLWEAGVKSTKKLLQKAVGDTALTFEELSTLLTKIEAVLNSRPLCPLSSDPMESDYLSPGHFLIGCPLLAPPEPSLLDLQLNRLDRWQLIKRMTQYFWSRWRVEYLSTLQTRLKWTQDVPNLKTGDLVILKEDNVPILHWPTGRIEDVHPGTDGRVRVVTVRTPASTFKRPVSKVIPLLPLSSKPYPNSS